MTGSRSLREALHQALTDDERVLLLGEAVGRLGGLHGCSAGLLEAFGPERVVDTPLSESGLVGLAIGLAMAGKKPIVALSYGGIPAAFEQLAQELATLDRHSADYRLPVIVRVPVGALPGLPEREGLDALAGVEGLQVLAAGRAEDLAGLLRAALASGRPTVILEPRELYEDPTADTDDQGLGPRVLREGSELCVLCWGDAVQAALAAADASPRSVGVVALRRLAPLDHDAIGAAVRGAGRVLVTPAAPFGQRALQCATQAAFLHLESPPAAVDPAALGTAIEASITY